ncbi:MAG: hypothetical protein AABN95_23110 [Acidobacteriota bacterium]
MIINVMYQGGWISIAPDHAVVKLGEPVQWCFSSSDESVNRIRWTVYFDQGSPFPAGQASFSAESVVSNNRPLGHIVHSGQLPPVLAIKDYKYGVKAENPARQEILADDDPRLLVLP